MNAIKMNSDNVISKSYNHFNIFFMWWQQQNMHCYMYVNADADADADAKMPWFFPNGNGQILPQ